MMSIRESHTRASNGGFTLIEIMVAITLLTIVLAIVYSTFSSVVFSIEEGQTAAQNVRTRQQLTRSFALNIAQATEGWSAGAAYRGEETDSETNNGRTFIYKAPVIRYWFSGIDGSVEGGPADSLSFVSTASIAGASSLPGQVKLVTYELVSGAEIEESTQTSRPLGSMNLVVKELPIVVGVETGGGPNSISSSPDQFIRNAEAVGIEPVTWNFPVQSLDIRYYDGKNWQDKWDAEDKGHLPWSVEILINFPSEDEFEPRRSDDEDADLRLIFTIPVGLGMNDIPPDYAFEPRTQNATI